MLGKKYVFDLTFTRNFTFNLTFFFQHYWHTYCDYLWKNELHGWREKLTLSDFKMWSFMELETFNNFSIKNIMSAVLFSLLLIFEIDCSGEFHVLNILKISKISFEHFASWVFFIIKLYQTFRKASCKYPLLVKPWFHSDLNLRFKFFYSFTGELKKYQN